MGQLRTSTARGQNFLSVPKYPPPLYADVPFKIVLRRLLTCPVMFIIYGLNAFWVCLAKQAQRPPPQQTLKYVDQQQ